MRLSTCASCTRLLGPAATKCLSSLLPSTWACCHRLGLLQPSNSVAATEYRGSLRACTWDPTTAFCVVGFMFCCVSLGMSQMPPRHPEMPFEVPSRTSCTELRHCATAPACRTAALRAEPCCQGVLQPSGWARCYRAWRAAPKYLGLLHPTTCARCTRLHGPAATKYLGPLRPSTWGCCRRVATVQPRCCKQCWLEGCEAPLGLEAGGALKDAKYCLNFKALLTWKTRSTT